MCAAVAVRLHPLAFFFAGCSVFGYNLQWPFAGETKNQCPCVTGLSGALSFSPLVRHKCFTENSAFTLFFFFATCFEV